MTIPPSHASPPPPGRVPVDLATWATPFASTWRARGYFVIAFVFWILNSTIPLPFKSIADADRQRWQDLIAKAFGNFDKVSYAAFVAGLAYAVLSDGIGYIWSTKVQAEMREGFRTTGAILRDSLSQFSSGLLGMSFEAVKVWVEGGKGDPQQVRAVGVSSLKSYYGPHHAAADNLVDFVLDEIMEGAAQSASQVWENFITAITIRACSIPNHFEWDEQKNYVVVCKAGKGMLPLRLEGSFQVGAQQLGTILDILQYSVRVGQKTQVDFKTWWTKYKNKVASGPFKLEEDGVLLQYDGVWLHFKFAKDCEITAERTPVVIYEHSFISEQDRCYSIAVRQPTKGLQATISLEEGMPNWTVKPPVASASLYPQGHRIVDIESMHARTATLRVPGWTLPGLAMAVEWTPIS